MMRFTSIFIVISFSVNAFATPNTATTSSSCVELAKAEHQQYSEILKLANDRINPVAGILMAGSFSYVCTRMAPEGILVFTACVTVAAMLGQAVGWPPPDINLNSVLNQLQNGFLTYRIYQNVSAEAQMSDLTKKWLSEAQIETLEDTTVFLNEFVSWMRDGRACTNQVLLPLPELASTIKRNLESSSGE